jgi:N-acetylglucosaminyldiphosphoundecaprenol N-acetyl-beta-D-mannosaminyltransferase
VAHLENSTAVSNNLRMQLRFSSRDLSDSNQGNQFTRIFKHNKVQNLPGLEIYLLGRRITCMTVPAIVEAINKACIEGNKIIVANYNVHSFNLSMQIPWYYQFLESAEITHCDSIGILKAIGWMGLKLPLDYRSSYSKLMPKVLEKSNEHGLSVFLLGSKADRLEAALSHLRKQYPSIIFFGHHGYFDKENIEQNESIIQKINQVKPHILVVGMGMPIQESWIQKHRSRLHVNAIMLGGAIVDRLAGVVPDCPNFISNLGLEWLYRLCREPKRLAARYLLGNPAFVLHMVLAKFYAPPLRVQMMEPIDSKTSKDNSANSSLYSNSIPQSQEPLPNVQSKVKRVLDYLVEANLLTKTQVEAIFSEQRLLGMILGEVLERNPTIKEQNIEKVVKKVIASTIVSSD